MSAHARAEQPDEERPAPNKTERIVALVLGAGEPLRAAQVAERLGYERPLANAMLHQIAARGRIARVQVPTRPAAPDAPYRHGGTFYARADVADRWLADPALLDALRERVLAERLASGRAPVLGSRTELIAEALRAGARLMRVAEVADAIGADPDPAERAKVGSLLCHMAGRLRVARVRVPSGCRDGEATYYATHEVAAAHAALPPPPPEPEPPADDEDERDDAPEQLDVMAAVDDEDTDAVVLERAMEGAVLDGGTHRGLQQRGLVEPRAEGARRTWLTRAGRALVARCRARTG